MDIERAAETSGLAARGGFRLLSHERVGRLAGARSVLLFGFVGAAQWPNFAGSPEAADGRPDPLDRWSRRVLTELADRFGAKPLFPFEGPPYWPFQAWARRAEPVSASPLGLLIHPDYGLSHSYRGALAFAQEIELEQPPRRASPCETCADRPCLFACPVGAFSSAGYAVDVCAAGLRSPAGADCLGSGCRARGACPVGRDYAQSAGQAQFHLAAFLAARAG